MKKRMKKSIEDMKQFSESVFFSLKNQRVDAKVASGIDAHKIHRVKRVPPRELKRKKKAVKSALEKIKRVSHLEDMKSAVKLDWSENIFFVPWRTSLDIGQRKKFLDGESFAHPGKQLKMEMGTGTVGNVVFSGYSINVQDAQKTQNTTTKRIVKPLHFFV